MVYEARLQGSKILLQRTEQGMWEGTSCTCWTLQECSACLLRLMHTRARVAGLQVDTLHLTVERVGSACRGLRSSVYANLESLAVTHVACEDDVQVQAAPCTMGLTRASHCVPSRCRLPVWCVRRRTGADTGGSGPPGAPVRDRISAREFLHLVQARSSQRGTDACSHGAAVPTSAQPSGICA